jgi:hypothetical protein
MVMLYSSSKCNQNVSKDSKDKLEVSFKLLSKVSLEITYSKCKL